MNSWLNNGLFAVTWVGFMWIADALLSNKGVISFPALMVGACVLALIGLVMQAFGNTKKV